MTLPCSSLLSLYFGYAGLLLILLQRRPILWCFIVYFRVIFEDLTCGFLSGIQDLWLFMHLLCTTLDHDISVTGLLLSNERYNRGLTVDQQALGLREASENSKVKRDNS